MALGLPYSILIKKPHLIEKIFLNSNSTSTASLFLPVNLSAPPFPRLAKSPRFARTRINTSTRPSGFSAIGSHFVATAILTNCLHCFLFVRAYRWQAKRLKNDADKRVVKSAKTEQVKINFRLNQPKNDTKAGTP
ncbi:hypothetical protein ACO0LB_11130 [Undibacterium sp. SXout7W]|uniref:hypothetical protein n=1 Tax=Undibacterium sp. SXout7W TaxID=3413049 RepID=UPI003BF4241F